MDESTFQLFISFPFVINEPDTEHEITGFCRVCEWTTTSNECGCSICNLDNFTFRCDLCDDDTLCEDSLYDYCEHWQLKSDIDYDYYLMWRSHSDLFAEMKLMQAAKCLPKKMPTMIIHMVAEYL